jgi:hypothetical protein
MANLLGGFSAVLRWEKDVSYRQIEGALIGVGFTDYLIEGGVTGDETTATISVHVPMELITAAGTPALDAVGVLRSVADIDES